MGDRALITFTDGEDVFPVVYLHWAGSARCRTGRRVRGVSLIFGQASRFSFCLPICPHCFEAKPPPRADSSIRCLESLHASIQTKLSPD
jgi:hypothetical protein